MRKLSLLSTMLVVGLVVGLIGVAGLADTVTDTAVLNRSSSALSLSIDSGGGFNISSFDPTSDQDIGTTTLKVLSTKNTDWTLRIDENYPQVSIEEGVNANETQILNHFIVEVNSNNSDGTINGNVVSGSNGASFVDYDYSWNSMTANNAAEYMPTGSYTITISYTVSAS